MGYEGVEYKSLVVLRRVLETYIETHPKDEETKVELNRIKAALAHYY